MAQPTPSRVYLERVRISSITSNEIVWHYEGSDYHYDLGEAAACDQT